MNEPASEQESIIHELSQHILGRPALFLPNNYGNSKEPADIAWISNRCAILMYMCKSKGSVEKKQKHNLRQLNRWLKRWQSGQPLTGRVGSKGYNVAFTDIDHIVGLSITEGGDDDRCEYHEDRVTYRADSKLDVCATITGKVMLLLAQYGYGPRDIVRLLDALRQTKSQRAPEDKMLGAIKLSRESQTSALSTMFPQLKNYAEFREHAIKGALDIIRYSKHADDPAVNEMGADFNLSDTLWFGFAAAALEGTVAQPGRDGPLWARIQSQAGIYNLECIMGSTLAVLNEHKQLPSEYPIGLTLVNALDFGNQSPIRVLFCKARKGQPSYLEQELATIRAATFDQSSRSKTE